MAKVKLDAYRRIALLGILPEGSDIFGAVIVCDIKEKIELTQKLIKEWEYGVAKDENGKVLGVKWNKKGDKFLEFEFSTPEMMIIIAALDKLDEDKKIETNKKFVSFYQEFMGNKKDQDVMGEKESKKGKKGKK